MLRVPLWGAGNCCQSSPERRSAVRLEPGGHHRSLPDTKMLAYNLLCQSRSATTPSSISYSKCCGTLQHGPLISGGSQEVHKPETGCAVQAGTHSRKKIAGGAR